MNAEEYSTLAIRTARTNESVFEGTLHAVLGIGGEAGEVVDMYKKGVFYGKATPKEKYLEEVGDTLWYVNLLIHHLGSSWSEVFEMNIKKLEARYPDLRFNADHAINRNADAEKEAMSVGSTP